MVVSEVNQLSIFEEGKARRLSRRKSRQSQFSSKESIKSSLSLNASGHSHSNLPPLVFDDEKDEKELRIKSKQGAFVLAVTCAAQGIDNIFVTGINIMLPHVSQDLNIAESNQTWAVAAYSLTFGSLLLAFGALADRFGNKIVFISGISWMSILTLGLGFVQSEIQFLVLRALQGIGAASVVPSAIGVIGKNFGKDRSAAYGWFGAFGAIGFTMGLVLSGLVTDLVYWRVFFWIFAPFLALIGVAAFFSFPKEHNDPKNKKKVDIAGSFSALAGFILLVFSLTESENSGWSKPIVYVPFIISFVVLAAFAYIETIVSNPIIPPQLWRNVSFTGIIIASFLLFGYWSSYVYFQVFISQDLLQESALMTGIKCIPMAACGLFFSLLTGKLAEKITVKKIFILAFGLLTIAPFAASAFTPPYGPNGGFWSWLLPSQLLAVAGISLGYVSTTIAIVSSVPVEFAGRGGGIVNSCFQVGGSVCLPLVSIGKASVEKMSKYSDLSDIEKQAQGYHTTMFICAGFSLLALLIVIVTVKRGLKASGEAIVH